MKSDKVNENEMLFILFLNPPMSRYRYTKKGRLLSHNLQ